MRLHPRCQNKTFYHGKVSLYNLLQAQDLEVPRVKYILEDGDRMRRPSLSDSLYAPFRSLFLSRKSLWRNGQGHLAETWKGPITGLRRGHKYKFTSWIPRFLALFCFLNSKTSTQICSAENSQPEGKDLHLTTKTEKILQVCSRGRFKILNSKIQGHGFSENNREKLK